MSNSIALAAITAAEDRRLLAAVRVGRFQELPLATLEAFASETLDAFESGRLESVACCRLRPKSWGLSRWIHVRVVGRLTVIAKHLLVHPGAMIEPHAHAYRTEIHIPIRDVSLRADGCCRLSAGPFATVVVPPYAEHSFQTTGSVGVVASVDVRTGNVSRDRVGPDGGHHVRVAA